MATKMSDKTIVLLGLIALAMVGMYTNYTAVVVISLVIFFLGILS